MKIKQSSIVFHKRSGVIYKVVGFQNNKVAMLVKVEGDDVPLGFNEIKLCGINHIEPLASKVFKVGDKVVSKLSSQPLVGEVVGIEEATNKVLIRSAKIDTYVNKRLRYAYSVDEIEMYDTKKDTASNLVLSEKELEELGEFLTNKLLNKLRGII